MTDEEVRMVMKLIVKRLANIDKWGGAHTPLDRIRNYLPDHLFGKKSKKIKDKAIKKLINMRFLLAKPSTGEIHVSLNPEMKKEIYEFIEKNEREEYKL